MLSCIFKTYIYLQYIIMALRYHHVLKSIWLEGKRNQCVDHLIHTLVTQYLPHMKICHKQQERGMEGTNLAKTCCRQILMCAPETLVEKIQKNDDLHFDVQSSNSNIIYQVNLGTTTCSCSDFPHVCLCKHIVAVLHFFGGADLGPQPPVNAGTSSSLVQQDGSTAHMDDSTAISVIKDIFRLSQELISKGPSDPGIANSLNSLKSIRSGLRELLNGSPLLEKENIAPNQRSWPETAMQMGVKCVNKCPNGKVDSTLTAQHIGEPNRKRTANDNLYGAGEQLGKQAKPNARSAAANTQARAAAEEWGAFKAEPPASLPLPKSLPLPASLPPPVSLPPLASLPPPVSLP